MKIHWGKKENIPEDISELILRVVRAGLDYCDASLTSEVSITFVGADEIRVLNRDWRGLDQETDVLSFPAVNEVAGVHRLGLAPRLRNHRQVRKMRGVSRNLGDIVICLDVAAKQAEEYGHSFSREIAFAKFEQILKEI